MKKLEVYTYSNDFISDTNKYQLSTSKSDLSYKSEGFELEYKSLSYDFRIYEPSAVCITLNCVLKDTMPIPQQQTIVQKLREDLLPQMKDGKVECVDVDIYADHDKKLAEGLYIHSLKFDQTKVNAATSFEVVLHCFSPDKRLTLDKYCQVYKRKTFGQQIFKKNTETKFSFLKDRVNYDATKLLVLKCENYGGLTEREFKKRQSSCENDKKKSELESDYPKLLELLQPYLVQYNESYYDFLRRVAHRCGEFLYFREGKLCLGLPSTNAKAFSVEAPISHYPEVNTEATLGVTVDPFSANYVKNRGLKEDELPKDKNYYDVLYASDENFTQLKESDNHIHDYWSKWVIFSWASAVLSGSNWIDCLRRLVSQAVETSITYGFLKNDVDKGFKECVEDYVKNMGITDLGADDFNFLNEFYYKIEQAELAVRRGLIQLDCSNLFPTEQLGDLFYFGNLSTSKYVVTRRQGLITNGQASHSVEAAPVKSLTLDKLGAKEASVLPPRTDFPFFLKSAPQEAVVCDVKDPLRMGRVRVRYLWQSETKDISPWIRMVVPFASGSGGMLMTPEKGDHLMINFVGQNIERPYAEGALFHANQSFNPGDAPTSKGDYLPGGACVISSASGHGITFVDTPGWTNFVGSLVPPLAQVLKIIHFFDKNTLKCNEADVNDMGGAIILRDKNDINRIEMSADSRSVTVTSSFGKVGIDAFTGITINAPNGDIKIKGKNVSIEAGNNISLKSGTNIHGKGDTRLDNFFESTGGLLGSLSKTLAKKGIKAAGCKVDPWKLMDVSFLRSMWEVIMRPVEGSLKLQSNRNVVMTAGKGKAFIPSSYMSDTKIQFSGKYNDLQKEKYANQNAMFNLISGVKSFVGTYVHDAEATISNIKKKVSGLASIIEKINSNCLLSDVQREFFKEKSVDVTKIYEKLLNAATYNDVNALIVSAKPSSVSDQDFASSKTNAQNFVTEYTAVASSLKTLKENYETGKKLKEAFNKEMNSSDKYKKWSLEKTFVLDGLETAYKSLGDVDFGTVDTWTGLSQVSPGSLSWKGKDTIVKKLYVTICMFVLKNNGLYKLNDTANAVTVDSIIADSTNAEWNKVVDAIESKKQKGSSWYKTLPSALVNEFTAGFMEIKDNGVSFFDNYQKLINYQGAVGPRSTWDISSSGTILLSNSGGQTYKLDKTGWIDLANPGIDTLKAALKQAFDANPVALDTISIS